MNSLNKVEVYSGYRVNINGGTSIHKVLFMKKPHPSQDTAFAWKVTQLPLPHLEFPTALQIVLPA